MEIDISLKNIAFRGKSVLGTSLSVKVSTSSNATLSIRRVTRTSLVVTGEIRREVELRVKSMLLTVYECMQLIIIRLHNVHTCCNYMQKCSFLSC